MKTTFRHKISRHRAVFRVIIVLSQIKIENGHPLFSVNYRTLNFKPIIADNTVADEDSNSEEDEE